MVSILTFGSHLLDYNKVPVQTKLEIATCDAKIDSDVPQLYLKLNRRLLYNAQSILRVTTF